MAYFTQIDIHVLSIVILVILLGYIKNEKVDKDTSTKIFVLIIHSTNLLLTIEMVSWLANGRQVQINYFLSGLQVLLTPIPVIIWIQYFQYKLKGNIKRNQKAIWIQLIPFYILTFALTINLFKPFVYYVDSTGIYSRGWGIYLVPITTYALYIGFFIMFRKHFKTASNRLVKLIYIFSVIPVIGGLYQLISYGVSIFWPTMTILLLVAFLYIEREALLKDSLTGLSTRGQLEDHIRYNRKIQKPFGLIMLDMNDFKAINDNFGHESGDMALKTVASILEGESKRDDLVCRYGGDEFMLIVESSDPSIASHVIDRIESSIERYNGKNVVPYKLSLSYGQVYIGLDSNLKLLDILRIVDEKMYDDKARRKSQKGG